MDLFLEPVAPRLKEELDFGLKDYVEIKAGGNNRLFKLSSAENSFLLLKLYNTEDDRQRLRREFQALSYLNSLSFKNIPTAYCKDDKLNYAIYSFETGTAKAARDLTKQDLDYMVNFLSALQSIKPESVTETFLPAAFACYSLQDYINNIETRLGKFESDTHTRRVPELQELLASDYKGTIRHLAQVATDSYSPEQLSEKLDLSQKRLSQVDFGPHNILWKEDGSPVFVDFEDFGWDDPDKVIGDFLNHDQSIEFSEENKTYFLNRYLEVNKLSPEQIERLDTVRRLVAIEWLTIYLVTLTQQKLAIRRFADKGFNEESYIKQQIKKYEDKLASLQSSK